MSAAMPMSATRRMANCSSFRIPIPQPGREPLEASMKTRLSAIALALALSLCAGGAAAQEKELQEPAALAKEAKSAKVPLEKGLSASESKGKPISAKYEVEDGKLQLSVYTVKGDKFFEVVVDHQTGKVS